MAEGFKTGGRQKGSVNKVTAEVRALVQEHGPTAIAELARLATGAASDAARVSACNTILDRAYGKALPGRQIEIDLPDTSTVQGVTQAVAIVIQTAASGEITPAEAGDFCAILESQRKAIELSDIETRLARLEASQGGKP